MPDRVARSGGLEHPPGGIQDKNSKEKGHCIVSCPPRKAPKAIAQQPQADGHGNPCRDERRLIYFYFTQSEEIDEDAGGIEGVGGDEEVEEEEADVQKAGGDADISPEAGLGVEKIARDC